MDDEQPRKRARLPTPKGGGSSDIPKSTNYEVSYLHRSAVARAACSARHGYVLTGSEDGVVKFWKRVPAGVATEATAQAALSGGGGRRGGGSTPPRVRGGGGAGG